MLPLLDYDWIGCFPSVENSIDSDLFRDCAVAELSHSILCNQYSPSILRSGPHDSTQERVEQLESNEPRLKKWVVSLPALNSLNQLCDTAKVLQVMKSSKTRQSQRLLHTFCLYHKVMFFIYAPWIAIIPAKLNDQGDVLIPFTSKAHEMRKRCVAACLDSAVAFIQVASHATLSNTELERDVFGVLETTRDLYNLLRVSLGVVFVCLATGTASERTSVMPYLGLCGALLGHRAMQKMDHRVLEDYFRIITSCQ